MESPVAVRPSSSTARPWTRWWWLGSAVTEAELTRHLELYAAAGFGGVEITPIYGAKGHELAYVPHLSPRWLELLRHTLREARRLRLGVDLDMGTGWPFGGPHISRAHAPLRLVRARAGEAPPEIPPDALRLPLGEYRGADGVACKVEAVSTLQRVKRAAPGGEGLVMDPYSRQAFEAHAAAWRAVVEDPELRPRAFFYDSFEVFGADYARDLPAAFARLKGRPLAEALPHLFDSADPESHARALADYRDTLFTLLLEDGVAPWVDHAHRHGILARYQAHGAPGNLLDLYARADIPETEVFGAHAFACRPPGDERLHGPLPASYDVINRFASSAAHLTGRPLCSSETFTWHREHFVGRLADMKPELDRLFLCGINHIVFHGSTYSPADVPWPGWIFYASTHFDPLDPQWSALPAFCGYIEACQSVLQSSRPVGGALLYFPYHDVASLPGAPMLQCTVHAPENWLERVPFCAVALDLHRHNVPHDFVSDRLLRACHARDGRIVAPGGTCYECLVFPPGHHLEPATAAHAAALAEAGARVLFLDDLERTPPGFSGDTARAALAATLRRLAPLAAILPAERLAEELAARGLVSPVLGGVVPLLARAFVRDDGPGAFIANLSATDFDGWVPVNLALESADLHLPRERRRGRAAARRVDGTLQVRLQLSPGETCFLLPPASPPGSDTARLWPYLEKPMSRIELAGPWTVEFVAGGPTLPPARTVATLAPWHTWSDEHLHFSGTARHATRFMWTPPSAAPTRVLLEVADLHAVAEVELNGVGLGTLWCQPFRIDLGAALRPGENELVLKVSNLAANRVADLERKGVRWHEFHEVSFVNIDYRPFSASDCTPRPAGVVGPATLLVHG